MSIQKKFINGFLATFAIMVLAAFSFAQEVKQEQKENSAQTPEKTQSEAFKREKFGRRDEFGKMRGHKGGMHRGGHKMMMLMHKLELSDAQREQMHALMQKHHAEMEAQRAEMGAKRDEMRALMEKKRAGTLTAEEKAGLEARHAEMKKNMQRHHEEMLAILTPEQKAKLEQLKTEMREKQKARRDQMRENRISKPTPKEEKPLN